MLRETIEEHLDSGEELYIATEMEEYTGRIVGYDGIWIKIFCMVTSEGSAISNSWLIQIDDIKTIGMHLSEISLGN